jgi:CPA2 family monovalent cation:H+ antiporter-2
MHETSLIFTIAISLGLAFLGGFVAHKLRLSPIVGYLLVGVLIGPHTPGIVADTALASELAEIGVILLMFGVGMHFSVEDLLAVRRIAVPGALLQIALATAMGVGVALAWGWNLGAGLVLGLALSVASTVVLLRALEERGTLASENGNIAVGWLIVEDLAMVLALVLLPALAGFLKGPPGGLSGMTAFDLALTLELTIGKVGLFVLLMLLVGRRLFPWLLNHVAETGSRELFTLFVAGVALGIAYGSAALFGVSFALGAFFAGIVIHGSDLSQRAAANALPLQDAFAVLFFVSVGMLFEPRILFEHPFQVLAVVSIIVLGKSLAAFFLILALRYPLSTALTVSASLAQIGEFSFILGNLGVSTGLLPPSAHSLILAGALISITLNPFVFRLSGFLERQLKRRPEFVRLLTRPEKEALLCKLSFAEALEQLRDHVVLVGYGRVGRVVGDQLGKHGLPFVVIEQNRNTVEELHDKDMPALYGDAESPDILRLARLESARFFVVTPLDSFQARQLVRSAWQVNSRVKIVVRTHNEEERRYLETLGGDLAVMGDPELALTLSGHILRTYQSGGEPAAAS